MAAPIGKNLKDTPTRVAPDAGAAKLARETPRDQAGEEAPVAPASPAKSIDAFDAVAVPTGAKTASGAVTEAGKERAARGTDDGANALRDRLQASEPGGKGATTSGEIAGPARTEAAPAAEAAKGAVAALQEPALSRDLTEENGAAPSRHPRASRNALASPTMTSGRTEAPRTSAACATRSTARYPLPSVTPPGQRSKAR